MPRWLNDLLSNLGSLVIASVAIGLLWELVARRAFMAEVHESIQLSQEVHAAGIAGATTDFQREVDWPRLLRSAHEVDHLFAFARTWRESHRTYLVELARRDAKVRLALPDPDDQRLMQALATRFNKSAEDVSKEVRATMAAFEGLFSGAKAELSIWLHKTDLVYAYYRFDQSIVVTLYSHSRTKGDVPVLRLVDGSLASFFRRDFENLLADDAAARRHSFDGSPSGSERRRD